MTDTPRLFVIAGPNGAGKTTLYETRLAARFSDMEFVNADRLARESFGEHATTLAQAQEGQRLAEARRAELMNQRRSFITESTFSHPSKLALIDEAKAAGYRVAVLHVNVRTADHSVARVQQRVENGGHPVPEAKIRERYERNQPLIREAVMRADDGFVYDNSEMGVPAKMVLQLREGVITRIASDTPQWAQNVYAQVMTTYPVMRAGAAIVDIREAEDIVREKLGEGASTFIPNYNAGYSGEVIGKTTRLVVQKTASDRAVFHFNDRLERVPALGEHISVRYAGRSKVADVVAMPFAGPQAEVAQAWQNLGLLAIQKYPAQAALVRLAEARRNELLERPPAFKSDAERHAYFASVTVRVAREAAAGALSMKRASADAVDGNSVERLIVMGGKATLENMRDGRWTPDVASVAKAGAIPSGVYILSGAKEANPAKDHSGPILFVREGKGRSDGVLQLSGKSVVRHSLEAFPVRPERGASLTVRYQSEKATIEPFKATRARKLSR